MVRFVSYWPRLWLAGFLFLGLCVLSGCGSSGTKGATVQGKVTVDGVPATAGFVAFTGANGSTISGPIEGDGSYKALDVPVGDAKVAVTGPPQAVAMGGPKNAPIIKTEGMPGMPQTAAKGPAIPQKYAKPETSALTYTVKSGKNSYNLDLTSK